MTSHGDRDHIDAVADLNETYCIEAILSPGLERGSVWREANDALNAEEAVGATDIVLAVQDIPYGTQFTMGSTTTTFVAGWDEPPADWGLAPGSSEYNNAGSIVVRIEYAGRSILLTGDTVGRHIGDPPESCIAAERVMVENASTIPINSGVIVAPHHGADNASSTDFIEEVSPSG